MHHLGVEVRGFNPACNPSRVLRRASSVCHATSPSVSRMLLAGFPLPLIPEVRRALDEAGQDTYHLDMIVCTDAMLDKNLSFVMAETPPIDWLQPIPAEWTELNVSPTLLFDNLHRMSQADVAEVVKSAANGWPVTFADCSDYAGLSVGEAIAQMKTRKPEKEVEDLIVDYFHEEEEEAMDEGEDDDSFMVSAGDVDAVDFSENLFLAIDDLTARAEETEEAK